MYVDFDQARGRLSSFFTIPVRHTEAAVTPVPKLTPLLNRSTGGGGAATTPYSGASAGGGGYRRESPGMSPFVSSRSDGSSGFGGMADLFGGMAEYEHPIYAQADEWLLSRGRMQSSSPTSSKENDDGAEVRAYKK